MAQPAHNFSEPQQYAHETSARVTFETAADAEAYLAWKRAVPHPIRTIVERVHQQKNPEFQPTGLSNTDTFLHAFAQSVAARTLKLEESAPRVIHNTLAPLEHIRVGTNEFINAFERFADPHTSWQLKHDLYERQVRPALEWLTKRDITDERARVEAEQTTESVEPSPDTNNQDDEFEPPPISDHVMSSMEAGVERGEGTERVRPQFTVSPYRGGKYKQRVFYLFDAAQTKWIPHEKKFMSPRHTPFDITTARVMSGAVVGNTRLALPHLKDWTCDQTQLVTNAPSGTSQLVQDQHGTWYLEISAPGTYRYSITVAQAERQLPSNEPADVEITGALPQEISKKISAIHASGAPLLKQARELVKFIRAHLSYSNSKDAWNTYTARPEHFFDAVWQRREADCYVSNTLACRALHELGARVQFVGGYLVKEKNDRGDAVLHGSNGHAWLEVWDKQSAQFIPLDATPAGDPTVDEKAQEQELNGEDDAEGEPSDDEIMSETEAEHQHDELKKQERTETQRREKKSPHNRREQVFAGLANCTSEQAREYLAAIERVRAITDTDGVPISEKLIDHWKSLIETRITETRHYRGPVPMSEGDRLDDPVRALADLRGGNPDPSGFEKYTRAEERASVFGGISLYWMFDLSGSMAEPDGASGSTKAAVQRDVALLFIDSIMQCAYVSQQQENVMDAPMPINIMATLASEHGSIALPLTNQWGPKEQWAIYSALTRTARGGTPTHEALELIEQAFAAERKRLAAAGTPEQERPLAYMTVLTDGVPNDAVAAEKVRARIAKAGMITRTYAIGGSSDSPDAGPPLQSFSELPPHLAHDILEEFQKLHPDRVAT